MKNKITKPTENSTTAPTTSSEGVDVAMEESFKIPLQKEERELGRKNPTQPQEDFIQSLYECDKISPTTTNFREAMAFISSDDRYSSVSEQEREKFFEEFTSHVEKQEREEQRLKRKQNSDNFRRFIELNREREKITVETQWRTFREEFKDTKAFQDIDQLEALKIFADYMKELEKREVEFITLKKIEQKKKSRNARAEFRELLDEDHKAGKITLKTRWKQYRQIILTDPRYLNLIENEGKNNDRFTPSQMFYQLIGDIREKYKKDKKTLNSIVKSRNMEITSNMTLAQFIQCIQNHRDLCSVDEANIEMAFLKTKEKVIREAEKSKRKAKKRFLEILYNCKITPNTTWETLKMPNSEGVAFLPLTDQERKELFNEELKKRALDHDFQTSDDENWKRISRRRHHQHAQSLSHSNTCTSLSQPGLSKLEELSLTRVKDSHPLFLPPKDASLGLPQPSVKIKSPVHPNAPGSSHGGDHHRRERTYKDKKPGLRDRDRDKDRTSRRNNKEEYKKDRKKKRREQEGRIGNRYRS
eukprot:TRINITY_DN10891_c0_g1_i1.p1 TRINITY_DN10891_c0_g1~~TRINITY_DN10891_c0_g1_i1.p1  ORF type:complete len:530 (-),score=144.53 TRINITY_DN10891_c0_g1_i1:44-1633(-)